VLALCEGQNLEGEIFLLFHILFTLFNKIFVFFPIPNSVSDKKVIFKLKEKIYYIAIKLAMLYQTKCWEIKCRKENNINVMERMLS